MRRILILALFAAAMLHTQGCFRSWTIPQGQMLGIFYPLVTRCTVRLFPSAGPQSAPGMDIPLVPAAIAISSEPACDPQHAMSECSPSWVTLFEFGPVVHGSSVGPGFKLQAPLPATLSRPGGAISLMNGWIRFLSPAWGPAWATDMVASRPTPDRFWEASFTRTDGWTGADGAATVELRASGLLSPRTLWLFGDSFIGPIRNGKHAQGTTMVNNTIAVSTTGSSAPGPDALNFFWSTTPDGKAAAWSIPEGADPTDDLKREWFWPSGGGIVAPGPRGTDRLVLFMTRLGRRDDAPKDSIWNFEARGTTVITIDNPQDDPAAWRQTQHAIAPLLDGAGRQVTWGAAVLSVAKGEGGRPDKDLYICGIDATSVVDKKLILARAPASSIEKFQNWRFWDGKSWSRASSDAVPIVSPLASELSMYRLDHGDAAKPRYVMIYSELTLGPTILCRTAERPQGPWSAPTTLYTCPEPATDKRLFVYAPKAHPELSRPAELLVSYCVNSTDFWDVLAHADKYRPRFVRIPISSIPAPKN